MNEQCVTQSDYQTVMLIQGQVYKMTLNIKTKLSLLISLLPVIANAMVINLNIFVANGGDIDNVAQTINYANLELRKRNYTTPYFTVGKILGCTATWVGNDDAGWAYILTAAHCVPYGDLETATNTHFRAWDGTIIAQGEGTIYVHENRINRPVGMGAHLPILLLLRSQLLTQYMTTKVNLSKNQ